MKAEVKMFEIITKGLQKGNKRGAKIRFCYIVKIDGVNFKIFPSSKTAHNWVYNMGFRLNDNIEYVRTQKSDLDLYTEMHLQEC